MTETIPQQRARVATAFRAAFPGAGGPAVVAVAPGRVNLIGEHTDYNDGFVMPLAIDRQALVHGVGRDDLTVRFRSTAFPGTAAFDLGSRPTRGEPAWSNYLRGALAAALDAGLPARGFDAIIDCSVPAGGGLSSSAAIEVATITLLEGLTGRTLDPADKARAAQAAEHEFAGVPCGIMDQLISATGREGHALLIDCRDTTAKPVPLDDPALAVLILNSNQSHALADGAYAQRRASCEAAAEVLGVSALRDADAEAVRAAADAGELTGETHRRARHVVTENRRCQLAAEALLARDYGEAGRLMGESHASLRDDYEVSTRELDTLVELADHARHEGRGVYGSRMTGGGFGGCTVTLVKAAEAEALAEEISTGYRGATGVEATAFITRPCEGARVLA
ncbi:galactokinase [Phycisphaera mikurensis]|uniref:Galactokinase n=1 Tax=Phycisphaera mikurensis (strain NBRC 102666 / KCTC 22515 / FYK2301M01) TaxID=1142394 RepID=I0IF47_PHYMF|nr:galactokinase [Phycisphaera mikurensis]MBB6440719.1 galactokinase [Phycisphaera mikurensis]BAM03885.1 galactokinase [Phycisphaera mikurensis NBRC 102666]